MSFLGVVGTEIVLKPIVPQRTLYDVRGADGTGTSANPVTPETSSTNLKTYTIRKLADGNCWMVNDNLNIPLALGVSVEASKNDRSTFTYVPTSSAAFGTSTRQGPTNSWFYNWYAATAEANASTTLENVDVDGSLCPVGWRLPANYVNTGSQADPSSYGALASAYGFSTGYASNATAYNIISTLPISIKNAGFYDNNAWNDGAINNRGRYWSSTARSASNAYGITYMRGSSWSDWSAQGNWSKSNQGYTIRCLAVR